MVYNLKIMHIFWVLLFVSASGLLDLTKMEYDTSDPYLRIPFPIGEAQDVYLHYDIEATILTAAGQTEHEIVKFLMTLTDMMNRETFNAVNLNLVTSSFSINPRITDHYSMVDFQSQKVLREGEAHAWIHLTDLAVESLTAGGRFGLYDGEDRSYAIVANFHGVGYTHDRPSVVAHEIGHLFGLDKTDVLSLSYSEVSINPDQCGSGPNGADCSTKPTIGGSLMSSCRECPLPQNGGGFKSAFPLTSLHPFQAEKIQEHYNQNKQQLADISRQKLRTFIPEEAESNLCADEGETCNCNGVVYFGPTISSDNPKIFGVEYVTGSVQCSAGAHETFADVFHGKSKSCYCHKNADLHDITYLPIDVEFTSGGIGECVIEGCGVTQPCYWEEYDGPENNIGHFTIPGQVEWKCKQECLDRDNCDAYNFKDGNCRLFEREPTATSNTGIFSGSTCWKRPNSNFERFSQPAYQIRDIILPGEKPSDIESKAQYEILQEGTVCPSKASVIYNEDECFHAISELFLETEGESWVGISDKKPSGCSFDSTKGKAYFNAYFEPDNEVGSGKSTLSPICKVIEDEAVGSESKCEFVAIDSHECPANSVKNCVDLDLDGLATGTMCKASFEHKGVAFVIDNCRNSDVFRYVCTDSNPQ